jgi:hypothetical protein
VSNKKYRVSAGWSHSQGTISDLLNLEKRLPSFKRPNTTGSQHDGDTCDLLAKRIELTRLDYHGTAIEQPQNFIAAAWLYHDQQ